MCRPRKVQQAERKSHSIARSDEMDHLCDVVEYMSDTLVLPSNNRDIAIQPNCPCYNADIFDHLRRVPLGSKTLPKDHQFEKYTPECNLSVSIQAFYFSIFGHILLNLPSVSSAVVFEEEYYLEYPRNYEIGRYFFHRFAS
jgi:hypothetical protein